MTPIRKKQLSKRQKTARKRKVKKILGRTFLGLLAVLILICVLYTRTLPDIRGYSYESTSHSVILTSEGEWIGAVERKNATFVDEKDIPENLKNAVIAIEDKRFRRHIGVDPISIARALVRNFRAGEIVEGGSSITQQLAKLLFFSDEVTYSRKLAEAFTAVRLEMKYTKDEIITMYLNEIYLGGGAYGVYEAAALYFGKDLDELSIAECAMLAGIITAPSAYCPLTEEGYGYAMQRKEKVLDAMLDQGKINDSEYREAMEEEIVIKGEIPGETGFEAGSCLTGCRSCADRIYLEALELVTGYYKEKGLNDNAARQKAEEDLFSTSCIINSTVSMKMQQSALDAVGENVKARDETAACAVVSMDWTNGRVLAYFGGDSVTLLDMASSAHQPGSNIKPLFMLRLIDSGIATSDDIVCDEPLDFSGYRPGNVGGRYLGYVTMRETLVNSLNCGSLRFFAKGNTEDLVDFVKSMGITTIVDDDYNYAFALGGLTWGIRPDQMCRAYCAIASGGLIPEMHFVDSVVLEDGTVIYHKAVPAVRITGQDAADQIKSCLYSTVTRGTGTPARTDYDTFGKTGTTDDVRDVWFTGSTGDTVTSIWVGTPDGSYIDGLSSAWCAYTYADYINATAGSGAFPGNEPGETHWDSLDTIYILKDGADASDGITEDEIAPLLILKGKEDLYPDRRVVQVDIDSSNGLLFSETCPEKLREQHWFLFNEAPEVYCTDEHHDSGQGGRGKENTRP